MLPLVLSTVVAFIPGHPAAGDSVRIDPQQLRAAVHFPIHSARSTMALTIGLGFSPTRGFHIRFERPDHDAEIARLRMRIHRGPVRARDLRALGDLYGETGEAGRARDAYGKSVTLYRRRARRGRGGVRALVDLGTTLHRNREHTEAELVLRSAVRREPGAWRGWTALAQVLEAKIHSRERGEGANAALLDETRRCYDRAVAVAPGESGPYAFRANYRGWSEPALRQILNGAASSRSSRTPRAPGSGCVEDLRRAAQLSRGDPYTIAGSAWLQFFYFASGRAATGDTADAWKSLSPQEQQPTRRAIVHLDEMARVRERHGDRRGAARVLTALGFIRYETFEPVHVVQGEADLRRALVLDPTRQDAAEMLMHVLAVEEKHAALADFVETLIRRRDTPRYRLITAYGCWRAGRLPAAEGHLRAALRLEPAHPAAGIALTAALLKSAGDERVLAEAERRLSTAGIRLGPSSPPGERAEHAVLRAVYVARVGSVEDAATLARDALRLDPAARGAAKLLELLRGPPAR